MNTKNLPTVKLDQFEGPFDLLLELARSRKLDLSEISLRTITDDFLGYIREHSIAPRLQGDFLVVASTLLLLKVRQLLPSLSPEEAQEVAELTDRVRIYQLYRQQAEVLEDWWGKYPLLPARHWESGAPSDALATPDVGTVELHEAMLRVIKKLPKPVHPRAHLTRQGRSLSECLSLFSDRLKRVKKLVFQDAIKGTSKQEAAVSFLAVLQMNKMGEVDLHQAEPFANVFIQKR